jgi:hypothetical protein
MNEDNSASSVLEQDVPAKRARKADITATNIDAVAVKKAKVAAQDLIDQLTQNQSSTATVDGKHNAIKNLRASSLLFENLESEQPASSNKLKELAGEFVNKQVQKNKEESSSTGLAALLRPREAKKESEKKRKGLKAVSEKKEEAKAQVASNEDYNGWKVIPINTAMGGLLRAAQQQQDADAKQGSA